MHPFSTQATPATGAGAPPRVHLVIGPVGAGKSTYVRQLVQQHPRAVPLNLDDWMATLFSPDRPVQPDADVMGW